MANALNPSIILSGQQPDIVGILDKATVGGQRAREFGQQNALNGYLSKNGAQVMAGDQSALNGLSQFGTAGLNAAQGVQSNNLGMEQTRLGMDATRQNMSIQNANQARLDRNEQRQIEAYSASLSAQQRAAEAAQIEQAVAQGMAAQTPEQWDQVVGQMAPDLVGQFENRQMVAARFMSIAEVMKGQQQASPTWRQATPEESAGYGAQAGQVNTETGQFKPFNAPSGMSIESDGQGGFSLQQGVGVTGSNGKSLTVDEGKNTGFYIRAQEAQGILENFGDEGTNLRSRMLENVPGGLGNYGQSPEYQKFDQAKRDMVNAILRRESGAVISDQEFDNADKQYFAQPGDSPEVIAQKRQNRINTIEGLRIGSGDGANRVAQPQASASDFSAIDAGQILQMDLSKMSEADLSAYMKRMDELGL